MGIILTNVDKVRTSSLSSTREDIKRGYPDMSG